MASQGFDRKDTKELTTKTKNNTRLTVVRFLAGFCKAEVDSIVSAYARVAGSIDRLRWDTATGRSHCCHHHTVIIFKLLKKKLNKYF